ncbi:hypothetical protein CIHG_06335 [Coccidioides immitis H538.4]|uniref:Uncharacterized protein n=1 Tax=Coccidioides immitis H538.4 TaxID=396776 RepID=A0A0J8RTJ8_COCIT|nr:hypothetical protein CIHG_06335 [Coccidioides immitis H538.4]
MIPSQSGVQVLNQEQIEYVSMVSARGLRRMDPGRTQSHSSLERDGIGRSAVGEAVWNLCLHGKSHLLKLKIHGWVWRRDESSCTEQTFDSLWLAIRLLGSEEAAVLASHVSRMVFGLNIFI